MKTLIIALSVQALLLGPILARSEDKAAVDQDPARSKDEREVVLLTDFTEPTLNERWFPRNDNVMGGRSLGNLEIDQGRAAPGEPRGVLTMNGSINLDGGGFTSVMMDVSTPEGDADRLPDFRDVRGVRLRVRASGEPFHRPFRLRLEDGVRRPQAVNFRGLMSLNIAVEPEEWQTVTVWLQHLRPTIRGQEVDPAEWQPLDTSSLRRLGVVLNDTGGGEYRLEIDKIELVR